MQRVPITMLSVLWNAATVVRQLHNFTVIWTSTAVGMCHVGCEWARYQLFSGFHHAFQRCIWTNWHLNLCARSSFPAPSRKIFSHGLCSSVPHSSSRQRVEWDRIDHNMLLSLAETLENFNSGVRTTLWTCQEDHIQIVPSEIDFFFQRFCLFHYHWELYHQQEARDSSRILGVPGCLQQAAGN